ncbi:cation diffusion facilitator family transporter [Anaerobranca gottschalkii]|uniref:Cation diffusion facilitator family transporter n=1 Tax=Anaerobranca gottschalkii DSM 13577 TaxID=1120990 RepID=A0A1I0C1I3_9FIRM|nr:cation diffusion facilitator family transporter [Anaerobranca gottschalkii]SET13222.1 cation diffusion facilitator family transporter [Anaerobranca gottschalkii DSM 13577]
MNKFKAALLAISVSIFLVVLKLVIGVITNSISIISDALHSFMDVLASTITLAAMYFAGKPPDKCHNYGHGRYEDLAAVLQSILILIFSVTIIYQSFSRIYNQNFLNETIPGIIVMSRLLTLLKTIKILIKLFISQHSLSYVYSDWV